MEYKTKTKIYKLSTKTFGKKAIKEVMKILPNARTKHKTTEFFVVSYVLRDKYGKMVGRVEEAISCMADSCRTETAILYV